MRALKSNAAPWMIRNRMNARTRVNVSSMRSYEQRGGITTSLTPWGEYEHAIDGVQVPAERAFRARAHRWLTT